jgi:hypothetical protein
MLVRIQSLTSVGHLIKLGPIKPTEDNLPQASKGGLTSQTPAVNNFKTF